MRQRLLSFRPASQPVYDPLERSQLVRVSNSPSDYQLNGGLPEGLLARSLLDAPCVFGAEELGVATAAVVPWSHQQRVSQVLVERFPERFLMADEVGLGKTIEVGLALRQLVLNQQVQRAVLLVPRSVLW